VKRPTFFISSTIYDFRDVRSALKFYLERQGCTVLASEFNDFAKPLDIHSYDACLKTICAADYFILLIGSRVGGWYDQSQRISITMREYREAYRLQTGGTLKLINFVRSDVWQSHTDRRELEKYLTSLAIDGSTKKDIGNYPSRFAEDAEFISAFIAEVSRNRETTAAVQGHRTRPIGNWLHPFVNFSDIIDVIDGRLVTSTPVEDLTMQRLLRRELREFIRSCVVKTSKGDLLSPKHTVERYHREHPIDLEGRTNKF
jgi:hypothetical protein